ncbi:MAG: carboxypeptidase-like regulatory domain-containing protein [Thermoplasmata archaeon]|nr:carboxypeptidase-like regulatory domain-containing protein [Thermoplasmata archaeon]
MPRAPGRRLLSFVGLVLIAAALLLAGVGGFLVWSGVQALGPETFTVQGTVLAATPTPGLSVPLSGAFVNVTGESGTVATVVTNATGHFAVSGLPAGGVQVNVSAPGFDPVIVEVFVSSIYATAGASSGLTISLAPTSDTATTTVVQSPFGSLESFLTSLGAAALILGIAAVLAAVGARSARRAERPTYAVAGGAATLLAPGALFTLGDTVAFPYLEIPTAVLAAVGALAISLAIVPLLWEARPPEPTE